MPFLPLGDVVLHWQQSGPADGPPVLLIHALGSDLRLFDAVVPLLPAGARIVRADLRGHGASSLPPGPYAMGTLIRDAERLMEGLGLTGAVVAGVSVGGMIAQGLAVKRLDLVRGLVLSNTAVKIATPAMWEERIAAVRSGGMAAIAGATIDRWFARARRAGPEARLWQDRLEACAVEGYAGVAAAIAGTDFLTPTSGLRLPALVVAGGHDGSTPPDLVRELADLIPGARFALIRGAGHVPPVDEPEAWAAEVTTFLRAIGHV